MPPKTRPAPTRLLLDDIVTTTWTSGDEGPTARLFLSSTRGRHFILDMRVARWIAVGTRMAQHASSNRSYRLDNERQGQSAVGAMPPLSTFYQDAMREVRWLETQLLESFRVTPQSPVGRSLRRLSVLMEQAVMAGGRTEAAAGMQGYALVEVLPDERVRPLAFQQSEWEALDRLERERASGSGDRDLRVIAARLNTASLHVDAAASD